MKRLTLLRHAKSGWDDPVSRDFDRPLNAKGHRASETIGRYMHDQGLRFDRVVSSPAVRCVETIESLAENYGETISPAWDKRVYLASGVTLLDVVQDTPDETGALLLIGHNPGLEDLALMLIPDRAGDDLRDSVEEKYPTASIIEIDLDIVHWTEAKAGLGVITGFVRPRDLDPALGPDD